MTFEGDNFAPIWSPDGKTLTFSSNRDGPCHIFSVLAGRREARKLVGGDYDLVPGSWSPDGRKLLFTGYSPATGAGIWMCEPGGAAPGALVQSGTNDFAPAIAPDGRLVAFTSEESGRLEVYVAAFPEFGSKTQVSVDGGSEPVWARDGRLYYRRASSILAAEIAPGAARRVGTPRVIVDGPFQPGSLTGLPNYDVAPDGRLLVIEQSAAPAQPDRLQVVVNWFAEIERRLA